MHHAVPERETEHNTIFLHDTPPVVLNTLDSDEDLVEVPLVPGARPASPHVVSETRSEFFAPAAPSFRQYSAASGHPTRPGSMTLPLIDSGNDTLFRARLLRRIKLTMPLHHIPSCAREFVNVSAQSHRIFYGKEEIFGFPSASVHTSGKTPFSEERCHGRRNDGHD
jgi:hypothetical protein